jgi:hypothetical protein
VELEAEKSEGFAGIFSVNTMMLDCVGTGLKAELHA